MMHLQRAVLLAGLLLAGSAGAESLYVTDRLLLGVYQNPSETSPLVKSVPSGTRVEVIDREDDFVQVRLPDGTEGWMSAQFLVQRQPAAAELEAARRRLKAAQAQLASAREELGKRERKLQVLRDELANARTSIKELKQKLAAARAGAKAPAAADGAELAAARREIEKLKAALAEAQQKLAAPQAPPDLAELEAEIVSLRQENQNLRARIEVALANLQGEKVPSPEELAAIHPRFPPWYWGLAATFLILGFIGGFLFFDYQHRRRHGGFRL